MNVMPKLGINIDHVATLRQARREFDPDPIFAAQICERAGGDSIVAHLREDRRHINDKDIQRLKKVVESRFNLEMSIAPEIVRIALGIQPDIATLVPERRQEITTEGGLNVVRHFSRIKKTVTALQGKKIMVSLFIAPDKNQITKAFETRAEAIELHTGHYANAKEPSTIKQELNKLHQAVIYARSLGLTVNAGHGLNYTNIKPIAQIPGIEELNIGHAIISQAIFAGLEKAVKDMLKLARNSK